MSSHTWNKVTLIQWFIEISSWVLDSVSPKIVYNYLVERSFSRMNRTHGIHFFQLLNPPTIKSHFNNRRMNTRLEKAEKAKVKRSNNQSGLSRLNELSITAIQNNGTFMIVYANTAMESQISFDMIKIYMIVLHQNHETDCIKIIPAKGTIKGKCWKIDLSKWFCVSVHHPLKSVCGYCFRLEQWLIISSLRRDEFHLFQMALIWYQSSNRKRIGDWKLLWILKSHSEWAYSCKLFIDS